jgi:hypothetical protein
LLGCPEDCRRFLKCVHMDMVYRNDAESMRWRMFSLYYTRRFILRFCTRHFQVDFSFPRIYTEEQAAAVHRAEGPWRARGPIR